LVRFSSAEGAQYSRSRIDAHRFGWGAAISRFQHFGTHTRSPRALPWAFTFRAFGAAKPYQVGQFLKLVEKYNLELGED